MTIAQKLTVETCPESDAKIASECFHCLEALPKYGQIYAHIGKQRQAVCCHGCKAAAEFIDGKGLAGFYKHRQHSGSGARYGQVPVNQANGESSWQFLDSDVASENYVVVNKDGSRELQLLVHGLYCSSCSWLIEKAIHRLDTNIQVRIDLDAKRMHLTLAPTVNVNISELFSLISHLGYRPSPLDIHVGYQKIDQLNALENRDYIKRILVAGFGMMQVMTYAVALYLGDAQGMDEGLRHFLTLVSMLVATCVVFYSGKPFFNNALKDLSNRHLGMDVPIALAIAGAYFPSVFNTLTQSGVHVYFDSAVMFVFFLLIGRYVEMRARHRLSAAPDALMKLLPAKIHIDRYEGAQVSSQSIKVQDVVPGDQLILRANDIVPFDAKIVGGEATLDESLISGEARGVAKGAGDELLAGSKVVAGLISVEARHSWIDSSIVKIERMLQNNGAIAAPNSTGLQQFSRVFVLAVLVLTIVTAIFWWFYQAERVFEVVLAMLIASCPCAFALAAPVSTSAASHTLRRMGILLSNAKALSLLPQITLWCFDKTGTLTKGKTSISDVITYADISAERCLKIIACIESHSHHVLANAFTSVESELTAVDVEEVAGQGICATVDGTRYWLGNKEWVQACTNSRISTEGHTRKTEVVFAVKQTVLAAIYLDDELRGGARAFLQSLSEQNRDTVILSGDRQTVVDSIAQQLTVVDAVGNLLPEQKLDRLKTEQARGHTVAMVGDGVNDAPVLSQADLSIALASGSELSQSQADVILLNSRLDRLHTLGRLASLTQRITKQNLTWALAYNALVLPLAASGNLTPWIAAIGMSSSSLLVVLNALRITKLKEGV